ncbi:MAG: hypothetical protein V1735_07635 [Nanoarchaeota archaeon]
MDHTITPTSARHQLFLDLTGDNNLPHTTKGYAELLTRFPDLPFRGPILQRFYTEAMLEAAASECMRARGPVSSRYELRGALYPDEGLEYEHVPASTGFQAKLKQADGSYLRVDYQGAAQMHLEEELQAAYAYIAERRPPTLALVNGGRMNRDIIGPEQLSQFEEAVQAEVGNMLPATFLASPIVRLMAIALQEQGYHPIDNPPAFTLHDISYDVGGLREARKAVPDTLITYSMLFPHTESGKEGRTKVFPFGVMTEEGRPLVSGFLNIIPLQLLIDLAKRQQERRRKAS